ncbi:MAG: hypothetical protein FJ246_04710 [Nitrospira sp.]|nr:hypothetical protein [Nitrospira sp.]
MPQRNIDSAIMLRLERQGACNLDELIQAFPGYAWNQMFAAIDRLSRSGAVTLQPLPPRDYLVSIKPHGAKSGLRRRMTA